MVGIGSAGNVTWLGRFEGRFEVTAGTGVVRAFGVAISGSAACGIGTGGCGGADGWLTEAGGWVISCVGGVEVCGVMVCAAASAGALD
jgi:hypothetical protein